MGTPLITVSAGVLALVLTLPVRAQELPPPAYQLAAQKAGIPSVVLYAVALQESGTKVQGRLRPWPWTLNVAGQSHFLKSQDAACTKLTQVLRNTPAKRVDVGLGQVNVGYHGYRVSKPCDLLDPYLNLDIAAAILNEQHKPGQDWLITMGLYHSPANGQAAARYRTSIKRHYTRLLRASAQANITTL